VTRTFPCSQCGAEVGFDPAAAAPRCRWCGAVIAPPAAAAPPEELDLASWLERAAAEAEMVERLTVRCGHCGAESSAEPNVTATRCPFCGSAVVAAAQSRKLIRPAGLLPFAVDAARAQAAFRRWLAGLWFAPSALGRMAQRVGALVGVYVPFWTFDAATSSSYEGERGDDVTVHEPITVVEAGRRVTRSRAATRTRWSRAIGTVGRRFDDVLVPAATSLPDGLVGELQPWDLGSLVPYDDAYLAGFRAESYSVPLPAGFERAKEKMAAVIRADVARDIGGDHQRIHRVDTDYESVTFKHVLLPVWLAAYRFRDRTFRFVVNARTGEVQGERPWSWVKIGLAVLAGFALLLLVMTLANR
jgi:DNA-directed RNA polymerase subunit RPC12/RpoP